MDEHEVAWVKGSRQDVPWVRQVLTAGFEVHYLDGDRGNLEPENLVMIWGGDIPKLDTLVDAAMNMGGVTVGPETVPGAGCIGRPPGVGEQCYRLRERGEKWAEIGKRLATSELSALQSAKAYSKTHNKPWPVRVGE